MAVLVAPEPKWAAVAVDAPVVVMCLFGAELLPQPAAHCSEHGRGTSPATGLGWALSPFDTILSRRKIAADIGFGLSTLPRWVNGLRG